MGTTVVDHDAHVAEALRWEIVDHANINKIEHSTILSQLGGNDVHVRLAGEILVGIESTVYQLYYSFGQPQFIQNISWKIRLYKFPPLVDKLPVVLKDWMSGFSVLLFNWYKRYQILNLSKWKEFYKSELDDVSVLRESSDIVMKDAEEGDPLPDTWEAVQANKKQKGPDGAAIPTSTTTANSDAHLWRAINKLADQVALLQTRKGGA